MLKNLALAGIAAALVASGADAAPKKSLGQTGGMEKSAAATKVAAEMKTAKEAEVGHAAPDFVLTDTDGNEHRLSDYADAVVVLEWFNPDCPFVKKHHALNKTMASTHAQFEEKEVVWLAINSGAPGKQGHGIERNQKARAQYEMDYPVLIDETGTVGRLYDAKTTPQMFVIDHGKIVYAGAIDSDRSAKKVGDTNYVVDALNSVMAGEAVETAETKSYGCSVKYGASAS